ncbi:MAG: lasso RiPP family leader peptide-containing protein [Trebonia sp.]
MDYEPPRIMVVGSVRDLTAGSTSSGNKDANSQYYW